MKFSTLCEDETKKSSPSITQVPFSALEEPRLGGVLKRNERKAA